MTATATRENRWATNGSGSAGKTTAGAARESGDNPAEAKPKRKLGSLLKSKKVVMALVAVLVVGGGAYKFLAPKKVVPPTGGEVVAMDATTLNLADGHYLKIAVAIQLVKGKGTATEFRSSEAAELTIDEFSNRTVASLSSNGARKKLTEELLAKVQKAYPGEVYDVFLTQFVMQ
jgi:flagellar FliL protein